MLMNYLIKAGCNTHFGAMVIHAQVISVLCFYRPEISRFYYSLSNIAPGLNSRVLDDSMVQNDDGSTATRTASSHVSGSGYCYRCRLERTSSEGDTGKEMDVDLFSQLRGSG